MKAETRNFVMAFCVAGFVVANGIYLMNRSQTERERDWKTYREACEKLGGEMDCYEKPVCIRKGHQLFP